MAYELELSKINRLKIAQAFQDNKRVDYSIDCVIEGQMGKAFVDDLTRPTAYRITIGPFWYFAGEARSEGGSEMLKDFPAYALLMPSPDPWLEAAQEVHGSRLQPFTRYSFSTSRLSSEHLANILKDSRYGDRIVPIGMDFATKLAAQAESYLEISDFDSVKDFVERGTGYAAVGGDQVMGVAYSSLVCSKGIEVSIYVDEPYRRQGVATALGSKLLLDCLQKSLRPNWDAANPESCKLAMKLGYSFVESYDAYFLRARSVLS
jgi:GNAT superfamily N-acetyltransferase